MKYLFTIALFALALNQSFSQSFTYDGFMKGAKNTRLTAFPIPMTIKNIGNGEYVISSSGFGGSVQINDTLRYDQYNEWEELYKYKAMSKIVFDGDVSSGGRTELTTEKTFTTKKKMSEFAEGLNINVNTINEDFKINISSKTVRTMSAVSGFRDAKYSETTIVPYLNCSLENENAEQKTTASVLDENTPSTSESQPSDENAGRVSKYQNKKYTTPPKVEMESDLNRIVFNDPLVMGARAFAQSFTFKQGNSNSELIDNNTTILQIPHKKKKHSIYPSQLIKTIEGDSVVRFSLKFNDERQLNFASSNDFTICYNENANSTLRKSNIYYTGVYDFDGDGIDEIILATRITDYNGFNRGDVVVELFVFRIRSQDEGTQPLSFKIEKVGEMKGKTIWGKPKATIEGKTITIPIYANGLYYAITWDGNTFKNTGNY